jgi:enoyl-CoA hydratase
VVLELTRVDEFALITLNRPQALNALNDDVLRELARALDAVETSDARALLITGAGDRAFCAGADIKELGGRTLMSHRQALEVGQQLFRRLDRFPIASVAVVNGYAFGGGLELALACTFRVATPSARLGLPEIKLGMVPGYGGTQRLPRVIGEPRALELVMTGRPVDAQEALRIGLVHRVIEGDRIAQATAFCREFSAFGLPALRFVREAVQRALTTTLDEGLKVEGDLGTLAFLTEDAREGMQAFVEKRPARFADR